jgi:hypothetical protein
VKTYLLLIVLLGAAVISLPAMAQIPNPGFETWSGGDPTGWVSSNINGIVTNVTQSAQSHSGSSAVKGDVVSFFTALLAPVIQNGQNARGTPYTQRPASVTGYYKFTPQGGDRFGVNVVLFHGGSEGTAVATAALAITAGASSYVQFNAPFVYHTNDIPDTVILQFQIVGPVTGTDYHLGSTFTLDDLAFAGSADVDGETRTTPVEFQLHQNYPNPFNPVTTISYSLPVRGEVSVVVFDLLGRAVSTLASGVDGPGTRRVAFDGTPLPSGVYMCRLQAGGLVRTTKMVLMK